jgi:CRP/FNR family transcriptional regulator, cyclic AMP receptor protein
MGNPGLRIGAHQFLRGLPEPYIARLAEACRRVTLPAKYRLFEEGGVADRFWLIDAGQVALDLLVPGDRRIIIEMLGRGDVVGLSWLQPPYQWRYGAITTQPIDGLEFDARTVRAACETDSAFGYAMMSRFAAVAARRLQATRARLLVVRAPAA